MPSDTSELLLGNPLHVGSVLLRREWQARVGLFDECLRSYEDWDLWLRLARAGCPMGWVPRPVSLYRFHREQMTRLGNQMTVATFAVLDKSSRIRAAGRLAIQTGRRVPPRVVARGGQAYTASDFPAAQRFMAEAVHLSPSLCDAGAEPLAQLVAGWANHVKTPEPLSFLARVYDHLPAELAVLRRRRRRDLSREALHLAFVAREGGHTAAARTRLWQAIGYRPAILLTRGVLAALLRSSGPGASAMFKQYDERSRTPRSRRIRQAARFG